MLSTRPRFPYGKVGIALGVLLLLSTAGVFLFLGTAQGDQLQTRELRLSNSQAGNRARYRLLVQTQTATTIGSMRVQFCANTPIVGNICVAPVGLDVRDATIASQAGLTGFTVDASTTANELILSRPPVLGAPATAVYEIDNVLNPSSGGSYYARVETFLSADATGPNIDYGGLSFSIQSGLSVHLMVPPFLLFCVGNTIQPYDCNTATGSYVDFGELSEKRTATGQTKLLVCTNADLGYTVRVQGTTMLSGINAITALSSPDVSRVGKSQFGMNIRANTTPATGQDPSGPGLGGPTSAYATPNQYKFATDDILVSNSTTENYRMYTISYIVNVDKKQSSGIYVTTLTYIALASF